MFKKLWVGALLVIMGLGLTGLVGAKDVYFHLYFIM